ncbi:MAG: hypothetical protein WAV00_06490 [Nocardioides sp.]
MASTSPPAYTCTGGDIPSGTYSSVTVTGYCDVAQDGSTVINIVGNRNVAAGAVFDAQSAPSMISVGRNVTVATGALVGLGCQPDYVDENENPVKTGHPCTYEPDGSSVITVKGNLTGTNADTVLLNGITVNRNVTFTGGGDNEIPWSVKNNTIGGNLTASGITGDWFGVLFNTVGRNVSLSNITATDFGDPEPTIYVVRNHVGHNLNCTGLGPNLSGGFVPGEVNYVGHKATGQCAALV